MATVLSLAVALAAPPGEGWVVANADAAISRARHEERRAIAGKQTELLDEVGALSGIWIGTIAATFLICGTGPVIGPLFIVACACACIFFLRQRRRRQQTSQFPLSARNTEAMADRLMEHMVREMSEASAERAGLLASERVRDD